QAFDGAIDDKAGLLKGRYDGPEPLDCLARTGGADWHNLLVAWRRNHDVERSRAHPQQRELGQMHIERARLRFGQDRSGVTRLDRTTLKNLAERVDPFRFDAVGKHDVVS